MNVIFLHNVGDILINLESLLHLYCRAMFLALKVHFKIGKVYTVVKLELFSKIVFLQAFSLQFCHTSLTCI